MLAVLDSLPDPTVVTHAEERLVFDTQVDASTAGESIRVPGRIVGLDVSAGGPELTSVSVAGSSRADAQPARTMHSRWRCSNATSPTTTTCRPSGRCGLGGGGTLDIVGIGMAPEYFFITTEDGGFFAQANFAALFASLTTAQEIAGRPGQVNDLVLAVRDGADVETVRSQLQAAFDASDTGLGVTVMTKQDEDPPTGSSTTTSRETASSGTCSPRLILVGAAFGAFNLSSRMVEAQRRELGIGMALGASRVQLAMRPMLVGIEIAVAGVVMGWSLSEHSPSS